MFSSNLNRDKIIEELDRSRKLNLNIQLSQNLKLEDIYALGLLQPLLEKSYLPFTASSLRPINLVHVLNNIFFNNSQVILEFGLGISSIIMGRLIKANNIDAQVISVEHDVNWIDKIIHILKLEKLEKIVNPVHAPLSKNNFHELEWYDTTILDQCLSEKKYDMVIVDGPPAYQPEKKLSRYPALPYSFDKLSEKAIVYLDDAHRDGEKQILNTWRNQLNLEFKLVNNTLAQFKKGGEFDNILFGY